MNNDIALGVKIGLLGAAAVIVGYTIYAVFFKIGGF